jgi:hypothetical protein
MRTLGRELSLSISKTPKEKYEDQIISIVCFIVHDEPVVDCVRW